MLSMLNPRNIVIPTDDIYCMNTKMDFSKSSCANISVKQKNKDYSLKKESYQPLASDDEQSDKSADCENSLAVEKLLGEGKKLPDQEVSSDDKKPSVITADTIRPYDILCGRDKATFNNVGNRRFRVLVSLNIPRYDKAKTKAEKAQVIKYICDVFRNEVGVRFLRKSKKGDGYDELSISEARKKVGHALRDMSVARRELEEKRRGFKSNKRKQVDTNDRDRRIQSIQSHINDQNTRSGYDDPLLEPLPLDEQNIPIGQDQHPQTQNFQQSHDQEDQIRQPSHTTPAHLLEQQTQLNVVPDPSNRFHQHQQNDEQKHNDLQQTLGRLKQQQERLRQEREQLLQQQQYQQDLLQQQIDHRRRRQQQQLQQLHQQQQQQQQHQQQQQQQQQHGHQFENLFDLLPRYQQPRQR